MPFEWRDEFYTDYRSRGYVVLRGIVPATLLTDLRREADKARAYAHEHFGPLAQRIQPLANYGEVIDLQPFEDYCQLPELHDAVTKIMGRPGYTVGQTNRMGLLIEPVGHPWNQGWHRDGPVEVPAVAYDDILKAKLAEIWGDMNYFNQVNCALYRDASTWYVPPSHLRIDDLPGEFQTIGHPSLPKWDDSMSPAEFERLCIDHCRSFPGAEQVLLEAGDYMLYRNYAWHCGCYLDYTPRATIHDGAFSPTPMSWGAEWQQAKHDAVERAKVRGELTAT